MDSTSKKIKKILVISLGMVIIFLLMTRSISSGPSNMGSGFAGAGASVFAPFLGGIASIIFIRGNFINRLLWSLTSIILGYSVIRLILVVNEKFFGG